jgi:hypothetical protein
MYLEEQVADHEARIAALEAILHRTAPAPSPEQPAPVPSEPEEQPAAEPARRPDETHVDAWRRWRAILRKNPDARIEYHNDQCAWIQSRRGIEFHQNVLTKKPATVREADELARRYSTEGAFGHLAWLLTWQEQPGYPFIRIHVDPPASQ